MPKNGFRGSRRRSAARALPGDASGGGERRGGAGGLARVHRGVAARERKPERRCVWLELLPTGETAMTGLVFRMDGKRTPRGFWICTWLG